MTHETWLAILLLGLAIVGAVVAAGRLRRDAKEEDAPTRTEGDEPQD